MPTLMAALTLVALGCAAEPQPCRGDGVGSCLADPRSAVEAPVEDGAAVSLIQKSVQLHEKGAPSLLGAGAVANQSQAPPRPECVAVKAAAAAYRFQADHGFGYVSGAKAAAGELEGLGYTFVKEWTASSAPGDHDYMDWWMNADGTCILTFKGSEHGADYINNMNFQPMDKWGVLGVHSGLVAELEPLLAKVDFGEIKGRCSGPLMVTGHSLGGGLAQLFALAVSQTADVLGAQLTVDSLYTFGTMPVSDTKQANPQAPDGCFAGGLYLNSAPGPAGAVQVDVVKSAMLGGHVLLPLKTSKIVLHGPGSATTYKCGTLLPPSITEFPIIVPDSPFPDGTNPAWLELHEPSLYAARMGC